MLVREERYSPHPLQVHEVYIPASRNRLVLLPSHISTPRFSGANGWRVAMSVANVDMFEFHDEEKANEWIRWYNREGPIGFSEAEVLLFVRTGPTSGLTLSVYPDDNARQAGSEVRQKFQAQQGDYVREITVFEGDVEMKHIKR